MSGRRIINVPLEKLFTNKRGNSKYTKKYCYLNRGEYEVYTGTTIGSFAKINTYEYDTPNLTYTTDGVYAGTVKIIRDDKYNIGGHRAVLISKNNNLYLEYFEYILEAIFKSKVKDGSVPSVTWTRIKSIEIPVPVDENGKFDFNKQREIAEKYKVLITRKKNLAEKLVELEESYINIENDNVSYKEVCLKDLFDYKRGGSCTKAFCNKHKGEYPVWSANNITPLAKVDFYQYDGKYISLSRNGIAGKITILNGRFSINEDRFLLIPKVDDIDYDFIKYTVEPILRNKKKGRAGHNGENEFTKLSFAILNKVKIKVPINGDGSYDIEAQKEISLKYEKLYKVKAGICEIISNLIDTEVLIKS